MPVKVTELAIELPLTPALKPPEPRDIVPEPLSRQIEPRPLLEEDDVVGAKLESVTELAPDFGARMGRTVLSVSCRAMDARWRSEIAIEPE